MGLKRCWRVAFFAAVACSFVTGPVNAYERQWRLGGDFGYAIAGLPQGTSSGFGGGAHVTYGITDAFNLRVGSDVTTFPLPDPLSSTLIWNSAVGAEYVIDILEWVPYVGLVVGPVDVMADVQPAEVRLGLEFPFGMGYQLMRELTVGMDGSYRLLLLGPAESGTIAMLTFFGRIEYVWGY